MKQEDFKEILVLGVAWDKELQVNLPAILDRDVNVTVSPVWVAAFLELVLDRFISCIDDESQIETQKEVLEMLNEWAERGSVGIEKRIRE